MAKQRVQVQGVGEAPVVAPVALPGFQYGIAQRKAGTNNLLQLAGNLEQVGLITKGYAGIVQQQQQREQALERGKAAQFKEQQIEEQRRQAEAERRQAEAERQLAKQQRIHEDMLKNHINTDMLPLLQSREGEVLDVEKYTSKAEASQHLDTIIGQARQGVIDLLGEGVANSLPSQLLVNSVIPKWKTTALDKYEKAQDDYTIDQENVQLMETLRAATTGPIDVINIQAIAEGHEKIMQEKGIDDATDRQRILENGFFATVDTLIAKGRYNDAQSFMNAMELTKVDNRSVFGSSASRLKLNDGIARVRQKMTEVNTQSTAQKREILKGRITSIIRSGVRDREDMPENKLNTLRSIFSSMNPEMQQEEVDQYVDKVFAGGGDIGQNLLDVLDEAGGTEGDLASALYYPILDDITRDYVQIKAIGPTPIPITDETIPEILKDFRSYVKDNPEEDAPWKGFLSDNPRIKKFDELLVESKRLSAGNYVLKKEYYTNIASQLLANLGAVDNQLKDSEITLDDRSYFYNSGAVSFIKNKVKEEAFRLQDQDEDVRDAALQDLTNELVQKERQRYEGMAKASAISYDVTAPITVEGVFKGKKAEALEEKYKTLFPESLLEQRRREIPFFRRDIEADRRKMFSADDGLALSISLTRYGYNMFDPESYKMLQKTGLDAADVQLFGTLGELNRRHLEFDDVLQKDLERQPLSEEEKKVKETYQGLGIYDVPSLEAFRKAQESYY
jgi:hypothetical protein